MTIGTPTQLGTAGGAAAGTYVITTAADIPANSTVLVSASIAGTTENITSITDSAGNVYPAEAHFSTTGIGLSRVTLFNALFMAAGSSITVNFAGATLIKAVTALVIPNPTFQLVAPAGQTGLAATSATTIASGVLGQNAAILFGILVTAANISGFTPGAGWTAIGGLHQAGASVDLAYMIVATSASQNWAPTWTGSANYVSLLRGYAEPKTPWTYPWQPLQAQ